MGVQVRLERPQGGRGVPVRGVGGRQKGGVLRDERIHKDKGHAGNHPGARRVPGLPPVRTLLQKYSGAAVVHARIENAAVMPQDYGATEEIRRATTRRIGK